MARTYVRESVVRTVSAADSAFPANQPAAPTTGYYTEVSPLPAGVYHSEDVQTLLVDVIQRSSSTANTYNVLGWNRTAALWVSVLVINVASGVQAIRTSIPQWASDYAFVVVAGSTVNADIYVLGANQTA